MGAAKFVTMFALLLGGCGGPVRPPAPADGRLIAFGGGSGGPADACFVCHGLEGEGKSHAPRIAGAQAGYSLKQLNDYAADRRTHPAMKGVAARLTTRERLAAAQYYAAKAPAALRDPASAPPLYREGDRSRGIRACADCHGAGGQGRGLGDPPLAGQPAAYTIEQLRQFKKSIRRNDPNDVMGRAARGMTEAEIQAIAAYLAPP